MQAFHFKTR